MLGSAATALRRSCAPRPRQRLFALPRHAGRVYPLGRWSGLVGTPCAGRGLCATRRGTRRTSTPSPFACGEAASGGSDPGRCRQPGAGLVAADHDPARAAAAGLRTPLGPPNRGACRHPDTGSSARHGRRPSVGSSSKPDRRRAGLTPSLDSLAGRVVSSDLGPPRHAGRRIDSHHGTVGGGGPGDSSHDPAGPQRAFIGALGRLRPTKLPPTGHACGLIPFWWPVEHQSE